MSLIFFSLYLDESSLFPWNKKQLSSLTIDVTKTRRERSVEDMNILLFTSIFTRCTNLEYLNFSSSSSCCIRLSFPSSLPTCISSNLLELHLQLGNFIDCLYMLDGRFNHLHTLHVDIENIYLLSRNINNKVD